MDSAHRFDLNRELSQWRLALGGREGITTDQALELETHLRELIGTWQAKGLTEEEAFWVATRRVGNLDALAAQFIQADPTMVWRGRVFWMVIGLLVIPLLQLATSLIGGGLIYLCAKYDLTVPVNLIALLASLLFVGGIVALFHGLVAGRWPRLSGALDAFCSRRQTFAWQLLLLALIPPLISFMGLLVFWWMHANGWTPDAGERAVQEAVPHIRLIFISQSILWPIVLAVLAGKYAPLRRPKPPSERG